MRAVVFSEWQTFPSLENVDQPEPGAGEVLLKVAGAGVCHSDIAIYEDFAKDAPGSIPPPFTLGHENAGWVEALGPGVTGIDVGAAFLVYGPIGCGHCKMCSRGQDTYCENAASMPYLGLGLGRDGGMAEYVTVPARNLVALGDADPVAAAPLADAGLTPYHAIKNALPNLAGGGRFALVIGLGGLGQIAVQMLTALTGATVIATDMKAEAMKQAEENGALTVPGGDGQVDAIRELTGGRGVDAAFDIVGATPTIKTAQASMAQGGRLTVVGIAGGVTDWKVRARFDLFGVLVLAGVVGLAGGITRDLLIGVPPETFRDGRYLAAAGVAGGVCFFASRTIQRAHRGVLFFDAVGLSLFSVTGASKAVASGMGPAQAVLLGAITGIGGGMLRDVLLRDVPTVLRSDLYAIPALAGAAVVAIAHEAGSDNDLYALAGAAMCLILRLIGVRYGVNVPIAPSETRGDEVDGGPPT